MKVNVTDKEAIKSLADGFIEECWPGISESQRKGITLSFFAGMSAMFQVMSQISKHPDEATAAGALELMVKSLAEVAEEISTDGNDI